MWRYLDRHFEEILGGLMLAVMVTVSFVNVVVRYCTNFSFAWSEEITINFFVWVVMLGTSRAFRDGSNLCMSLLYEHSPKPLRGFLSIVRFIMCIAFFAVLGYLGYVEVMDEIELESTSDSLGIPVWIYTCCVPLLSGLIIVRIVQRTIEKFRTDSY